jgi:hypothetical protein
MKTLYHRISPANEGIVLAEPARAEYVSELHNALSVAQTWGEFRKLMPFDEYLRYISETFGEPGNLQAVPADHEEFDSSWVWGYLDGDYPPWLQTEIGEVLPPDLLGQYAFSESSMLNGDYYMIFDEDFVDLKAELEARGYELIDRSDLYFY